MKHCTCVTSDSSLAENVDLRHHGRPRTLDGDHSRTKNSQPKKGSSLKQRGYKWNAHPSSRQHFEELWHRLNPGYRRLVLFAIALSTVLWIGISSGPHAYGIIPLDAEIETADVVLDGQSLFEVADYGNTSAQERADQISSKLANAVDAGDAAIGLSRTGAELILIDATGEPIDNGQLLTVSKNDARAYNRVHSPDVSAERLAAQWQRDIQAALTQARTQRSPDVIRQSLLISIGVLVVTAIAYWWLRRTQRRILANPFQELQRILKDAESDATQIRSSLLSCLISITLFVARFAIWVLSIGYVINLFPQTRESGYRTLRIIRDSLISPVLPLGDNIYSAIDLLVLIGAFLGIFLTSTLVTNVLRSRILNIAGLSAGSREAIATLTRYTLIALGALVVLQVWGLDLSSLALLASALGVGIGFGFQNIARDFGSGLILLFERPVQVGDFVEVGAFQGTVNRIGARSTSVVTLDRVSIIVPNSYFLENQVINWSHENPLSRIAIPVGVSYNSDPEEVRTLLIEAAANHEAVVKHPNPQVFFDGFGDSALNFLLLVWIVKPERQLVIKSELYFQVFRLLNDKGIKIPFPQRDLHVRSGHLPVKLDAPTQLYQARVSQDSSSENGGVSDLP
ncbi:MAG: mechanosensitive ion channel domain-containing protein [Cyanobacteria bacterium J06627_8]